MTVAISEIKDLLGRGEKAKLSSLNQNAFENTGCGIDFSGIDLSHLDLSDMDLRGANFNQAKLAATNFKGSNLSHCKMVCAITERANFSHADLSHSYAHGSSFQICKFDHAKCDNLIDYTGALFHGCSLINTSFKNSQLSGTLFYQCKIESSHFDSAQAQGVTINECELVRTNFPNAMLDQAQILRSKAFDLNLSHIQGEGLNIQNCVEFSSIDFSHAHLKSLNFINICGKKIKFQNAHLHQARIVQSQIEEFDMRGSNAENMNIIDCKIQGGLFSDENLVLKARGFCVRDSDLSHAVFKFAYLYRAFFTGDHTQNMNLSQSTFEGANIVQSYLSGNLKNSNFKNVIATYARLNQCDFEGSDLEGADLYQASIVKSVFNKVNLQRVRPPVWIERSTGLEESKMDSELSDWIAKWNELHKNQRSSTSS